MEPNANGDQVENDFVTLLQSLPAPRVLENGTLQWHGKPTHHKHWAPHASEYVMTDVEAGPDVDVVSDAHSMSQDFSGFDAFISCSVWEHLSRPWVAAQEAAKVVKVGGIAYVNTHQSFPLHGYPHDYFRFSTDALSLIFEDAGFDTLGAGYIFPCVIQPPPVVTVWNRAAPAYLNVAWYGIRRK